MASIKYNNIYINDNIVLAGPMEGESKLKKLNLIMDDYYFGEKTFEQAEIKMQKVVFCLQVCVSGLCHYKTRRFYGSLYITAPDRIWHSGDEVGAYRIFGGWLRGRHVAVRRLKTGGDPATELPGYAQ